MNEKFKLTYILHYPLGVDNNSIYNLDLLNTYFSLISQNFNVSLVGTKIKKDFYHNSLLTNRVNSILLSKKSNKNIIKKTSTTFKAIRSSDVCFLFMPSMSAVLAGLICFIVRKPFVTYFGANWHDLIITNNPKRVLEANFKKWFSNFLTRNSIFTLHTGKGILESHKGNNKYLTSPIFNLSTELFYQRSTYKDLLKSSTIQILFVGTLSKNKGVSYLLDALAIVNNEKITLEIIGDGSEKDNLKNQAIKLGIASQVYFHGFISNGPEVFDFYKKSDMFILPSFSEGLPRVLYEAAGNGCPIITTPVNSVPYLFKDNYDCIFIKPGDKLSIANAINRLIKESRLNNTLALNAYKTVEPILKEKAYEQHSRLIQKYLKKHEML